MRNDDDFVFFNESLRYFIFNHDVACLDENIDFKNIFENYCIRRAINNIVDNQ